ncbi:MAG: hypothetical protein V1799_14030 [bacterium]
MRKSIPITSAQYEWLEQESKRQINGCAMRSRSGITIFTPDGHANYNAQWTRDFAYMVENDIDSFEDSKLRVAIQYLLDYQREDGCIPDRVDADRLAVYEAGPVGHPVGLPPADNSQFMVKLVADYVDHTGDLDFFKRSAGRLIAAMNYLPRGERGLIVIDSTKLRSPYGFTDTVAETGESLFPSLLYWEACKRLEALFMKTNDHSLADEFSQRALLIEKNCVRLWDDESKMFFAATGHCRQIDIWGNAFAIYIGFPLGQKREYIEHYLAVNFDRYTYKGQIRHLPNKEHWERTLIPIDPETYQNGAYWGTAAGWLTYALNRNHRPLARKLMHDLIEDYQKNGAHECINVGYAKLKDYVVSVTNPLGAIRKIVKSKE